MKQSQIGNSELISTVNCRLVLQAVRLMQPTYRAAVARHTGLKPATVTSIVNGLIGEQMLTETAASDLLGDADRIGPGLADSRSFGFRARRHRSSNDNVEPVNGKGRSHDVDGSPVTRWGRPPLMLEVNRDVKRILAIDLEPDVIRVALTNVLLDVVRLERLTIDRFSEPAAILRVLLELCDKVMHGVPASRLLGVGVSLPGVIDRERGVMISSTNMPAWRDVNVAALLARKFRAPIHVERSIRLAALYERWTDPGNQDRTVLIASVRTGIGLSIVHAGELYSGNRGYDGEIGHTVVELGGRPCECGNRGCLEAYIGAPAVCARARSEIDAGRGQALAARIAGSEKLSAELVYRMAGEGDPCCGEIVREVGRFLGVALANAINLLAPYEVVICGSIDAAGEVVLAAVREQIERSALPRTRRDVVVRLARQQERVSLLGAAVLVAQELFQLPRLRHAVCRQTPVGRTSSL